MEIINLDKLFPKKKKKKVNELAPDQPFRMLMVGSSGSGKTNVLIDLILRYLVYDKLYVYTKHLHQSKYKILQKIIKFVEEDELLKDVGDFPIAVFADDIKNVVPLEKMDEKKDNVIIFDDFITEKNQKQMIDMFVRGRHKNASVIYLTQSYFSTPKDIRINCNQFLLFGSANNRDINLVLSDHCSDMDKEEFRRLYNEATSEQYSFFYIDKDAPNKTLKFRKKFDDFLVF